MLRGPLVPRRARPRGTVEGDASALVRDLLEPFDGVDLDHALSLVACRAAEALAAGQCSIFLRHPADDAVALAASYGLPEAIRRELAGASFPVSALPAWVRRVLVQREPAAMQGPVLPAAGLPAEERRLRTRLPYAAHPLPWDVRPVLAVPLTTGGRALGAIFLAGCPDAPGERHLAAARILGACLGPAVAVARARAQETKELDLRNIGLALSAGASVDATLQMVAEMTAELVDAQLCLVLTLHEESSLLRVRAASTQRITDLHASAGLEENSLIARVIETGMPNWQEDGVAAPRLTPRDAAERISVRSGLAVPIRDGSRITGAITVYHDRPRAYPSGEVQVLSAIAARAGAAIRNATHYEQQREVADTVRRSLAPHLPRCAPGIEWGHAYLPRIDRVGGDLYDIACLSGGRYGIVIGDVSGHGLRAAVHTAMAKYLLRAFGMESPRPGWVLGRVNDAVCAQSHAEVFLTLFYAVLYPSGRLVYANGGHSYPMVRRAAGHEVELLETTGTVVGMLAGETYRERTVCLRQGDILLLYTDGITEAERHGERFGTERLQSIVQRWEGEHPQALADHIVARAREFGGGRLQDDAAVLAIRRSE